eukprot:222299-Prymnesium_polylepis.1
MPFVRLSKEDVVALSDVPATALLNVGLVWMRSNPMTQLVARRIANRSLVAWDQGLFNEEAVAWRLQCCASNTWAVAGPQPCFERVKQTHGVRHNASTSAFRENTEGCSTATSLPALDILSPPASRARLPAYPKWSPRPSGLMNPLSGEFKHRSQNWSSCSIQPRAAANETHGSEVASRSDVATAWTSGKASQPLSTTSDVCHPIADAAQVCLHVLAAPMLSLGCGVPYNRPGVADWAQLIKRPATADISLPLVSLAAARRKAPEAARLCNESRAPPSPSRGLLVWRSRWPYNFGEFFIRWLLAAPTLLEGGWHVFVPLPSSPDAAPQYYADLFAPVAHSFRAGSAPQGQQRKAIRFQQATLC